MLAEAGDTRSMTSFGTRLADDTWLRSDLMVFRKDQAENELWYIRGAPLLVVEVASRASRSRDLGTKKDAYERAGVPHYWVVDPGRRDGKDVSMHVFELADGCYAHRAEVAPGESCWVTEPFRMELAPDLIFDPMSRWTARTWRKNMDHAGPDLPSSEDPILIDAFGHRWPTGAEKVELEDGCPIFYGDWDERDVAIAERAYPGRVVRLDQPAGEPGTMTVLPGPEQS